MHKIVEERKLLIPSRERVVVEERHEIILRLNLFLHVMSSHDFYNNGKV